jgi:polyferredoxin
MYDKILKNMAYVYRANDSLSEGTVMTVTKQEYSKKKTNRRLRWTVLVFVLLLATAVGLAHLHQGEKAPVGIDALCPFGAIESAYTLIFTGFMLKRIATSSFILFFAVLLTAFLFRRSFCGFICPLGALQEISAILGKKILGVHLTVPAVVDRPARLLKYLVLLLVVVFSAITGELVLRPYDPWVAYQHLTGADLFTNFQIGFAVLVLTLLGSFFFDRVFCKYLCPMGAFLAPFGRFGWFGIHRKEETCLHCKACNNICPVQIDVAGSARVDNMESINCNECVNVCPAGDTLSITGPKNTPGLPGRVVQEMVAAIFILIIGVTTLTGNFQWKNPTLEEQVTAVGSFDPALIKGSMTLQEVVDSSGIPAQAFIERFKVEHADFQVPIKNIAQKYGFETEDVRLFAHDALAR